VEEIIDSGLAATERIRRCTEDALAEWLNQSERLWLLRTVHGLAGEQYVSTARKMGLDRSTAMELVKLHHHSAKVRDHYEKRQAAAMARGLAYRWPGWKTALTWACKGEEPTPPEGQAGVSRRKKNSEALALANSELEDKLQAAERRFKMTRADRDELADRVKDRDAEIAALKRRIAELEAELAGLRPAAAAT
jgi:hypothetical protein